MTEKIKLAYAIALVAHKNQYDKVGVPYINHPLTVSNNLETEDEKIVGLLHDVVEDTAVTLDDLRLFFDKHIIEAIDLLTHKEEDSYMDYLAKIKTNPLALKVKLADLNHNMDMSRFENPTKRDYERLEKKYKPAYEFLTK